MACLRRIAVAALLTTIWSAQPEAASAAAGMPLHVVRAKETLWSIGQMHRLAPETIARASGLASPDRLQIGQRLAIPAGRTTPSPATARAAGVAHIVQAGETSWSIAGRHGLSVDALAALNGLADADRLRLGQTLILTRNGGAPRAVPRQPRIVAPASRTPRVGARFAWPSRGVITSRFGFRGRRHHHGVDISAPIGAPITAALDGTVEFAGWLRGYGRLVILDHGAGLTTYYGHASQLLVKVGDRVQRGQFVARVGTTGNVTGPNVHFEVRRNKVPLDPLTFLRDQGPRSAP